MEQIPDKSISDCILTAVAMKRAVEIEDFKDEIKMLKASLLLKLKTDLSEQEFKSIIINDCYEVMKKLNEQKRESIGEIPEYESEDSESDEAEC